MLRCFVECPRICFERVQKFLDFLIEWARIFALREYLKKNSVLGEILKILDFFIKWNRIFALRDYKKIRLFCKVSQNLCFRNFCVLEFPYLEISISW